MELIPSTLAFLYQQISIDFNNAFEGTPTLWQEYATQRPSGTDTEIYGWTQKFPQLREWIGDRVHRDIGTRAFSVKNRQFELTIDISRNQIVDNKFADLFNAARGMGEAARRWPDVMVADALKAGATALCFDGQPYFYASHPVDINDSGMGTYCNVYTTKPLTISNVAEVWAAMAAIPGEDGLPLGVNATTIMVPPSLRREGQQICNAMLIREAQTNVAGTENVGAAAVTNVFAGNFNLIVNPLLTTPGQWYLMDLNKMAKPLLWQLREAPTLVPLLDPAYPNVFSQNKFSWGVAPRGEASYIFPALCSRCTA